MVNKAMTSFHTDPYDSEDASGSISPLPPVLSNGLVAVATFGFLSFLSSLWLLSYLTYRFVVWHVRPPPPPEKKRALSPEPESPTTSDANGFLVPASALCPPKNEDEEDDSSPVPMSLLERMQKNPPNQFLILIYNLLFADIQQAMAFLLNITWIANDSLDIKSTACWAQGWFISTGDLASSVFITAIAIHTYLGVVKNYRLPTWIFYSAIACCWSFTYGLGILGVIVTDNGSRVGGLYVRAGAWCWINSAFQDLRLYLHYLWIFISLALTTLVYIIIYFHLQVHSKHSPSCCLKPGGLHNSLNQEQHDPSSAEYPGQLHVDSADRNLAAASRAPTPVPVPSILTRGSSTTDNGNQESTNTSDSPRSSISISTTATSWSSSESSAQKDLPSAPLSARHPTFLLYPLIYVLCTAPLAAGRIASMAGNKVPLSYFCFAGAMIASAGWLDVALYASTRRTIVFHSGEKPPGQDTGIETFAFMRSLTPPDRKFGNVVFVEGGPRKRRGQKDDKRGISNTSNWGWSIERGVIGGRSRSLSSSARSARARLRYLAGGRAGSSYSVNGSSETIRGGNMGFGMDRGEVVGMAIQCETTTSVVVEEVVGPIVVPAPVRTASRAEVRVLVQENQDRPGSCSGEKCTGALG
ncbi:G protein-coupled glucose receptor regulating Gpa2-domain-containing protein [Rhypophila decipiens]|uniref:G protein-coupled glucose receptor regulating Gpa2-domain-containing protein n=1 Tax=Rhypophila decipiens TaxID=261697 RepID=A0AAN6Y2Y4_9PEZI|nr:G protein-coupled glucose receptor regulating Gpa2-domain-containing protein [Rhypophila decipiens]